MERRRTTRLIGLLLGASILVVAVVIWQRAPVAAVAQDADAAAKLLATYGYKADFTPGSLWDVDRYLEDGLPGSGFRENKLRELGAYTGEVIRRAKGGSWIAESSAPAGVELELPGGTRCSPHGRVARRLEGGRDDGIALYAQSVGVDVKPFPEWWFKAK